MTRFLLDAKIEPYRPSWQNGSLFEPKIRRVIAAEALKQSNKQFSSPAERAF